MLNENSQRTLSQLFMRIIEGENKIEILRKCLCENYDFSLRVLFRSLCRVYSDSILPKDLKEFLAQNSEEVKDQECYLLVRQYSSLQNGRLGEEDFSHLVLSATNDTLPYLVSQRLHVYDLKVGVKYSFLSLLREELKLHREAEALKVQLFQDPDFSLWKAFEYLNSGNKGYVSESDITSFLQKRGRFISQNDYDALMRRIDLEDDLVISYNEFLEALIPLQVPKNNLRPSESKPVSEVRGEARWKEKSGEKWGQESASFGNGKNKSTEKAKREDTDEDRPFKAEELDASCRAVESENNRREGSEDQDFENLESGNLDSQGSSKVEKMGNQEFEDEKIQVSEKHDQGSEDKNSGNQESEGLKYVDNQEREEQEYSENQEIEGQEYSDNQEIEGQHSDNENFEEDEQRKSEELKNDDLEKLSDEDN